MTAAWRPCEGVDQAQRDACMHALGELYAARHLTREELDARVAAALAAGTVQELDALLHVDAHDTNDTQAPSGGEADTAPAQSSGPRGATAVTAAGLGLVAILVGAAAAFGGGATALAVLGVVAGLYLLRRALQSRADRTAEASAEVPQAQPSARPTVPEFEDATAPVPPQTEPETRELILIPVVQIPSQRQPSEPRTVRPPIELGPAPSALALPSGSADAETSDEADENAASRELSSTAMLRALPGPAPKQDDDVVPERAEHEEVVAAPAEETVVPASEEDDVRTVVSHLRPLLHRVAERAHGRHPGRTPRSPRASADVNGER